MLKPKVEQLMNEQIKHELESAYIYLSMVSYFEDQNLDGMAAWMRAQTHEETIHAMKFFDHISERGGRVKLLDLKQHKTEWSSVEEAWKDAYDHEQFITGKIHDLLEAARAEKDYAAEPMLTWFVEEQIEEEDNTSTVLERVKRVGDSKQGLYMLDQQLASRAFPAGSPFDPTAYSASGSGE
jgi:ferritin